jgi:hypothetical protein
VPQENALALFLKNNPGALPEEISKFLAEHCWNFIMRMMHERKRKDCEKAERWRAKMRRQDPELLKAKQREWEKRWREKTKARDPEEYRVYCKGKSVRDFRKKFNETRRH